MLELLKQLWIQGFPCVFYTVTGWYCPGCGGTRSLKAFLRGDFLLSLQYHPIFIYMAFVIALELFTWELSRLLKRPGLHIRRYHFFLYLGVALILGNWLVKDYFLIFKGIPLIP